MLKQKVINYFDAFENADVVRLKNFFSEDVCLRDWNIDVSGMECVIHEISNIFKTLSGIEVLVLNMYQDNATIISELIISGKEIAPIKVVDIITFDENDKICSIVAYKG